MRLQPDNDLVTGQRAARDGRYDLAITAFERARAKPEWHEAADRAAFQAMRDVNVSQYLVGQIFGRLGRPLAQYRGFDAIDPPLDGATVAAKLQALAAADGPARQHRQSLLLADRLERGDAVDPSKCTTAEHPALAVSLARRALARGDFAALDRALAPLDQRATPLSAGQALRARAMQAQGATVAAAQAFNLALLYLDSTTDGDRLRYRRVYKGYQVIHFKGEFYAIPWNQSVIALEEDGQEAAIIAHRVPARLRALARRLLPSRLVDALRRIVLRIPLRQSLSLDDVTRSSDLLEVLQRIDGDRDGRR